MATHGQRVGAALDAAVEDIRNRQSPYRGGTQEESGQLLAESIRRRGERLRAVGGGRIDEALNAGAEVGAQPLLSLPQRIQTRLAGPNPQVPEHYIGVNTPVAAEALQRINDFVATVPKDPSARVSLAGVNQLRRNLLPLQGANSGDARALGAIKNELDNWITDIAGGDPSLADLRYGNDLYRQGSEIIEPRGRDVTPAQTNVARLAQADAEGTDAVRIFRVNAQGGMGAEAARTARHISNTFGANSPQMQRVRDIATTSLLDGGPQAVSNRIDNFLTGNRSAAEAMFSPDQIARLERFRDVTRTLVPDPRATNPSRSSYGIMRTMLRSTLVGGGAIVGHKLGGDVGGVIDMALTGGGALAGTAAGEIQANRAVNPGPEPTPTGGPLLSHANTCG